MKIAWSRIASRESGFSVAELITVVAIIVGPVLALFAQRVLDLIRHGAPNRGIFAFRARRPILGPRVSAGIILSVTASR